MPGQRWESPHAWLRDQINELAAQRDMHGLRRLAHQLGRQLDAQGIEDCCADDMQDTGFFDHDQEACAECGERVDRGETVKVAGQRYCPTCAVEAQRGMEEIGGTREEER